MATSGLRIRINLDKREGSKQDVYMTTSNLQGKESSKNQDNYLLMTKRSIEEGFFPHLYASRRNQPISMENKK